MNFNFTETSCETLNFNEDNNLNEELTFILNFLKENKFNNVSDLRILTPKMLKVTYKTQGSLKTKGIWNANNKPENWPDNVFFGDPNNKNSNGSRPTKIDLKSMFLHLIDKLQEMYPNINWPCYQNISTLNFLSNDNSNLSNQSEHLSSIPFINEPCSMPNILQSISTDSRKGYSHVIKRQYSNSFNKTDRDLKTWDGCHTKKETEHKRKNKIKKFVENEENIYISQRPAQPGLLMEQITPQNEFNNNVIEIFNPIIGFLSNDQLSWLQSIYSQVICENSQLKMDIFNAVLKSIQTEKKLSDQIIRTINSNFGTLSNPDNRNENQECNPFLINTTDVGEDVENFSNFEFHEEHLDSGRSNMDRLLFGDDNLATFLSDISTHDEIIDLQNEEPFDFEKLRFGGDQFDLNKQLDQFIEQPMNQEEAINNVAYQSSMQPAQNNYQLIQPMADLSIQNQVQLLNTQDIQDNHSTVNFEMPITDLDSFVYECFGMDSNDIDLTNLSFDSETFTNAFNNCSVNNQNIENNVEMIESVNKEEEAKLLRIPLTVEDYDERAKQFDVKRKSKTGRLS